MIMTVKDADKPEAVGVAKRFEKLGYKIYATRSTAKYLQEHGVNALRVNKIYTGVSKRYGSYPWTQDRPCNRYTYTG